MITQAEINELTPGELLKLWAGIIRQLIFDLRTKDKKKRSIRIAAKKWLISSEGKYTIGLIGLDYDVFIETLLLDGTITIEDLEG